MRAGLQEKRQGMNTNQHIVIVEDEKDIVEVMAYNLSREGFGVVAVSRGDEGINVIRREHPDLVILDLMLPGIDGLTVCRQLKTDPATANIPIIIVSAKGEDTDVVIGLGLGADDYVTKPFGIRELLARVRAILRRLEDSGEVQNGTGRIEENGLLIDVGRHEVKVSGQSVSLTTTEFRILHQLASHPGKAFTRSDLILRALGGRVVVTDRNVDVHIRALRKKLGTAADMIETIRGVGYRFSP